MGYRGAYGWQALGSGLRNIGRLLTEGRREDEDKEARRLQEEERLGDKAFRDLQWSLERGGGSGPVPTIEGPGAMAPVEEQAPMPTPSAIEGVRMPSKLPPQYEVGSQSDPRYSETPGGNYFKHPAVLEQEERDRRDTAVLMERQRVADASAAERARLTSVYAGLPNVTDKQATALGGGAASGVVFPTGQPDRPPGSPTVDQAFRIVKEKYAIYERPGDDYPSGYGLSDEQMYSMAQEMAAGKPMPLDPRPHGPPMSLDPTGGEPTEAPCPQVAPLPVGDVPPCLRPHDAPP